MTETGRSAMRRDDGTDTERGIDRDKLTFLRDGFLFFFLLILFLAF